jgi:WD40 repeat protein
VAFSVDGKRVAAAGPQAVHVWDVNAGREQFTLPGGLGQGVTRLAFSPDGRRLATGTRLYFNNLRYLPGVVTVWDLETRKAGAPLYGHLLAFSRDGKLVSGGNLRLWDLPQLLR